MSFRRKGKFVSWRIDIPEELDAKVRLLLKDKSAGRIIYGARSHLITQLLENYFATMQSEPSHSIGNAND